MKTIQIPTDVREVKDLLSFTSAIAEINKFQKNLDKFAEKIIKDKYLKSGVELVDFLSDEDLKIYFNNFYKIQNFNEEFDKLLDLIANNDIKSDEFKEELAQNNYSIPHIWLRCYYLVDIKNQCLIEYYTDDRATLMGDSSRKEITYSFSDDGIILTIYRNWSYRTSRFPHSIRYAGSEKLSINLQDHSIKPWK